MNNRIDIKLAQLHDQRRTMLSPYVTAGDPEPGMTVALMHALVKAGADVLELGLPFSDPMAEGPVIQAAMERALKYGIHCDDVFEMVREFRMLDTETPVVLMGYVNPIEQYGYDAFAKQARHVGVDGTIIVDMPPEESHEMACFWDAAGLYPIYLCSPTTSDRRMALIASYARGYLYYVSLKGVTGSNALDLEAVQEQYLRRKAQTSLPLMVGFGIKTPEMAADVASFADGVIVGAALITEILEGYLAGQDAVHAGAVLIEHMRRAMNKKDTQHD